MSMRALFKKQKTRLVLGWLAGGVGLLVGWLVGGVGLGWAGSDLI